MEANDYQIAGSHYAGEYQHWDFVEDLKLGYFTGNITKYVSRARKKNGLEDLRKAMHYLVKVKTYPVVPKLPPIDRDIRDESVARFCRSAGLEYNAATVVTAMVRWEHTGEGAYLALAENLLNVTIKLYTER